MDVIWQELCDKYHLNNLQLVQLQTYLQELVVWNAKFNLTAIEKPVDMVALHFADSLSASDFLDFRQIHSLIDVGSGAGFPGLPLKIRYPHLKITLLEVVGKKVQFLEHLVGMLQLDNVVVKPVDWRTFLRCNQVEVDLVCARASLQPSELVRIFKPNSWCQNVTLVYWAAQNWQPQESEQPFITDQFEYQILDRCRKLIVFKKHLK